MAGFCRVLWPPEQENAIMTCVVLCVSGPCHTHHSQEGVPLGSINHFTYV